MTPQMTATLLSLAYFFGCAYIMVLFQLSIEFKEEEPENSNHILGDVLFDVLPYIKNSEKLVEILINVALLYTLGRLFTFPASKRHEILQHALTTAGTVYLFRGVTLALTPLPNPFPNCESGLHPENPMMFNALLVVLKLKRTCKDVLFSGHAMSLTLCILVVHKYYTKSEFIGMGVYCCIGYLLVVATKFHYSVDVELGIVITVLVFLMLDAFRTLRHVENKKSSSQHDLPVYITKPCMPIIEPEL